MSTAEFDRCLGRLELAVAGSCDLEAEWPDAVAGGVCAALEFAAADPAAAQVLTRDAIARWQRSEPSFVAMVDRFAALLSRAPAPHPRLPDARSAIARIARQVNLQLEAGREVMAIAPDLTFLALMPYLGFAGARHWSQLTATA